MYVCGEESKELILIDMNKSDIEENFGDLVQEEKSLISLLLDSSLIFIVVSYFKVIG